MPFTGILEILKHFLRGAARHPKEALFQKGLRILNMVTSYHRISLNHLANNLIYLSASSSFSVTLPPLLRHHQAAADVAPLRCHHCRSRRTVTTVLPPLRCAPPPRCHHRCQAATAILLSRCHHSRSHAAVALCATAKLLLPLRRRQAVANIALSCCRHCHCRRRWFVVCRPIYGGI